MTPIIGRATSSSAATRRPDEAAATRASQTGLPSSFSTAMGAAAEPAAAPASLPVGRGVCLRRGFSSQWFIVKWEPWHKTQVGLMLQRWYECLPVHLVQRPALTNFSYLCVPFSFAMVLQISVLW